MKAEHEAELRLALAEGVLSKEELEELRVEALRLDRGPLSLLAERGKLSEETLASLRGAVGPALAAGASGPPHELPTVTQSPEPRLPAPDEPVFPVPGWDRYQPIRFLGQGGMGRVFLAYDARLRRNVALKFVRDGDAGLAQRFLSEARAQARVDHERVCKVFEVGEVRGTAYIAMQYVDGRTLGQLAQELTLEQKLLMVREAAEGIHEAHRVGLIHRDLKPSNILVECGEDGRLRPTPFKVDGWCFF